MKVRLETFTNRPLLLKTKRGSDPLAFTALSVNDFFDSISFLPIKPKNKTLLRVLREDSIEAWAEVCSELDIKNWTNSVLASACTKVFETLGARANLQKAILDEYSIEFLFINFARQNQLELFWDIQIKPTKKEESKSEEHDPIQDILYLSTVCNKLGIHEINGQKLSINNYLELLTWPQYYYLIHSDSIKKLIMFSNANNLFGSDEDKKEKSISNIEKEYLAFQNIMKSLCKSDSSDFEENEYFSEQAEKAVRARGNDGWIKLYEFFKEG